MNDECEMTNRRACVRSFPSAINRAKPLVNEERAGVCAGVLVCWCAWPCVEVGSIFTFVDDVILIALQTLSTQSRSVLCIVFILIYNYSSLLYYLHAIYSSAPNMHTIEALQRYDK